MKETELAEKSLPEDNTKKIELSVKQADEITYFNTGLFFKYMYSKIFGVLIALLVSVVVGIAVSGGVYFFSSTFKPRQIKTIYNLKFTGIDQGKNPFGGAYDNKEIISAEVISRTIDSTGINVNRSKPITVEDFRQHIQIEGIVPDDTMQRILAYRSIIEEDPTAPFAILDQKYFPVQFVITLNKPASWDLSDNDAKNFLDSLINTYYEWFTEYYGNYSLVSELDANDSFLKFEDYDYVDQLSLCEIPLDRLNTFLTEKNTEKGDFISPSTGLRFSDILQQANVLKDVDATQIDSLIYGFNLTKDKNRLLAIYNSQVLNLQINLEAAKKTVTNIEQAIASYERTQSTLLLPSYGGSEGESAAPLTVSGSEEYDNLTRQKVDAYATVTSIEASIKKLQDRSQRLSNNVEIVPGARREVYEATVEANLRKLRDDINSLVKVTNTVAEEYYKGFVFQDAIQTAIPSSVQSPISLKILLLLFAGCALGIPFLILVWYVVRAFFHVSKQQRENVNV